MKRIFLFIAIVLMTGNAWGQTTFTAIATGDWNARSTWFTNTGTNVEGTDYPGSLDSVVISGSFNVTVPTGVTANAAGINLNPLASNNTRCTLTVNGSLNVTRDLTLNVPNTNNNLSSSLVIGSTGNW
jgi:hypothetical protein